MQRISITNPQNIIDGTAKKYYFKLRNTGGPKGDKGDKGDTGATGPQGPQGDPCTVVVNSTATLEPGSNAYVTNTGSLSNAVLDFGIPKGDRGPQGAKGDKGDTGAQGETGPRGPQGEKGTNATVYVGTTSTLAPGSQATVYNSGSDSNAVLNFGIPKGEKGDTGSQGPTGPAGQNFAPTIVAELPATGDESKLYLTPKAHTTSTATGNPIEATVTEQAGQLESFQFDGDTFQQTYTGKNLFNKANVVNGIPSASDGSITSTSSIGRTSDYISVIPNTAYSHTGHPLGWATIAWYKSDKSFIERTDNVTTTTSPNEAAYARVSCAQGNLDTCQFEIGQPTDYEPYVGGQPSPNPDYPQAIQTVTGEQTVTINSTSYPISLGSIELCKLGTYQDYIYKDGENWKVHKAIKKSVFDQNSGWIKNIYGTNAYNVKTEDIFTAVAEIGVISPQFIAKSYNNRTDATDNIIFADSNDGMSIESRGITIRNTAWSDLTSFTTWVASNPVAAYYVLATPTDTIITDQTLIAQLEAIRTASLQNGANTITNTATGSNLAGDMEIGYYGYNPTNRYDKFIWLDINDNYEQIGE